MEFTKALLEHFFVSGGGCDPQMECLSGVLLVEPLKETMRPNSGEIRMVWPLVYFLFVVR